MEKESRKVIKSLLRHLLKTALSIFLDFLITILFLYPKKKPCINKIGILFLKNLGFGDILMLSPIVHYLKKNNVKNKSMAFSHEYKDAKRSELAFKIIHQFNNYYLLDVKPFTGRHHQIRAQLSNLGNPIKGDLKYGASRSNKNGSIHLHSRKIEFIHPVSKKTISIIANPPKDNIWDLCIN